MSDVFAPPISAEPSRELASGYLPIATRGTVLVSGLAVYAVSVTLVTLIAVAFEAVGPETDLGALIAVLSLPILFCLIVSFIVCVVGFCMFGFRANKNLYLWTESSLIQHTPGWAAGWWFVPILNLWKPYQVFSEIWILSDPDVAEESQIGSSLVGFWWGAWVVGTITNRISTRIPDSMAEALIIATLVAGIAMLGASLLAIRMVRGIVRRQAATAVARGSSVAAV